jgi:hypothetical protein
VREVSNITLNEIIIKFRLTVIANLRSISNLMGRDCCQLWDNEMPKLADFFETAITGHIFYLTLKHILSLYIYT